MKKLKKIYYVEFTDSDGVFQDDLSMFFDNAEDTAKHVGGWRMMGYYHKVFVYKVDGVKELDI
jgi:hypothetical protein